MATLDKISIVVPAYNAENRIERCLASLLAQSYPNIEVVVVDDGSTDKTQEVVQHLAGGDERVRLIGKRNEGPSLARKLGVQNAVGNYVCFVDSDDWVEPDYCLELYVALEATGSDLATCNVCFDYGKGRSKRLSGHGGYAVMDRDAALAALHRRSFVYQYMFNKLMSRELLSRVDFVPLNIIGEDYDFTVQLLEHARSVVHIPQAPYHYVQRKESLSRAGYDLYRPSYEHYRRVQERLRVGFPHLADDVALYHIGDKNLATLFSMARGGAYDEAVVRDAREEVKKHLSRYLRQSYDPPSIKSAALLLVASPKLFFEAYGVFADMTGRRRGRGI